MPAPLTHPSARPSLNIFGGVPTGMLVECSLDILSVLLTKTRQTLAKDATLTAFEDVLLETLRVRVCRARGGRGGCGRSKP